LHQNFPGQFLHLSVHLARNLGWRVVGMGDAANIASRKTLSHITTVGYPHKKIPATGHIYLRDMEDQLRQGQSALRALLRLRERGFTPHIICSHPGWGESLFLREAFPRSKIVTYCEFFYGAENRDFGFDPEFSHPSLDDLCRLRLRNAVHLLAMETSDHLWASSQWQSSLLPHFQRPACSVIHEGIDTSVACPDPNAQFRHQYLHLTAQDSVLTYVARNLEPYRGFHTFMRSLPEIMEENPQTQVVVVGGDDVSYGTRPAGSENWRTKMLAEAGTNLPLSRIHFVGKLPYQDYLSLLQISSAHVYLTYPFVLSWSCLEAMSAGCIVIASQTPPVEEVIRHGINGLLVDFFDYSALARQVSAALQHPDEFLAMRKEARKTIENDYDLHRICLPRQVAMLRSLME
jgi:glycosyltransferase involved in cell wall biosynthesis